MSKKSYKKTNNKSGKKFHKRSMVMIKKIKSNIKKLSLNKDRKSKKRISRLKADLKYHQRLLKSDIFFPRWAGSVGYYKKSNAYNDRKNP